MNDLRKLQLIQLDILKDIDKICKDNNLQYYLIAGTLLGAVRHHGFIPWDDDIDIAMYREDLCKLEEIITLQYSHKYSIQNCWTDNKFTRFITKVRLNNTKMIEADEYYDPDSKNVGIWIDIFPIDYVEKTGLDLKVRELGLRFFSALIVAKHLNISKRKTTKLKRVLYYILKYITKYINHSFIVKSYENICTKSSKQSSSYSTIFMSAYGCKKELVPNGVYGSGKKIIFEGHEFTAPNEYEYLLRAIYGDYMMLPPVEKRITDHRIEVIDYGNY